MSFLETLCLMSEVDFTRVVLASQKDITPGDHRENKEETMQAPEGTQAGHLDEHSRPH